MSDLLASSLHTLTGSPRLPGSPPDRVFLTAADIPPNTLRLRAGEWVRILRERPVVRVGYRLRADDLLSVAREALKEGGSAWELRRAFCRWRSVSEGALNDLTVKEQDDLANLVARQMVRSRNFGGPHRGILVQPREPTQVELAGAEYPGEVAQVFSTRTVRVGRRFGPSGSGEDYENGGLAGDRPVILVRFFRSSPEWISGDLEPLCPARCLGTYQEGTYIHTERCRR